MGEAAEENVKFKQEVEARLRDTKQLMQSQIN
jgi:hypothetical protein